MKKIQVLLLCAAVAFNVSCGNDDDGGNSEIKGSLSVEEGKNQLEDNNIELLNKIEDFKNNDALSEIIELAEFLSPAKKEKASGFQKVTLNTIDNIANINASSNDVSVFNAKQSLILIDETSLLDDFNEEKGIYNWNDESETFEKTEDSDDIIYNIEYNGKTAKFSVTDFNTTVTGSGENTEEFPTVAKANLKISNTVVFSQDYSASFTNGQLIPAKINNKTTIGGFAFNTNYTNSNNKTVKQSFEFKIDKTTILGFNYNANGDFSKEDENVEDIFDNATMSFQFLNANLLLTANDTGFDSDSELSIEEQIELLNNNTSAQLSINNKSIAKSEFYKDEDTYMDYIYNPNTQDHEETEVTEYFANIRFLFEDGTTSDFDTYIDGSFTELEDKFDTVFDAYEDLFDGIE